MGMGIGCHGGNSLDEFPDGITVGSEIHLAELSRSNFIEDKDGNTIGLTSLKGNHFFVRPSARVWIESYKKCNEEEQKEIIKSLVSLTDTKNFYNITVSQYLVPLLDFFGFNTKYSEQKLAKEWFESSQKYNVNPLSAKDLDIKLRKELTNFFDICKIYNFNVIDDINDKKFDVDLFIQDLEYVSFYDDVFNHPYDSVTISCMMELIKQFNQLINYSNIELLTANEPLDLSRINEYKKIKDRSSQIEWLKEQRAEISLKFFKNEENKDAFSGFKSGDKEIIDVKCQEKNGKFKLQFDKLNANINLNPFVTAFLNSQDKKSIITFINNELFKFKDKLVNCDDDIYDFCESRHEHWIYTDNTCWGNYPELKEQLDNFDIQFSNLIELREAYKYEIPDLLRKWLSINLFNFSNKSLDLIYGQEIGTFGKAKKEAKEILKNDGILDIISPKYSFSSEKLTEHNKGLYYRR